MENLTYPILIILIFLPNNCCVFNVFFLCHLLFLFSASHYKKKKEKQNKQIQQQENESVNLKRSYDFLQMIFGLLSFHYA